MARPSKNVARISPDPRLERLERLSYYLDNAIRLPGLNYRIGYDALIGLLPGVGDLVGVAVSAYIVLEAARYRLPVATLARMIFNVGVEALVGAVPLLGDVFDATWKANARNIALLRDHLGPDPRRAAASDRRFFAAVAVTLIVLLVGLAAGAIFVLRAFVELVGS